MMGNLNFGVKKKKNRQTRKETKTVTENFKRYPM